MTGEKVIRRSRLERCPQKRWSLLLEKTWSAANSDRKRRAVSNSDGHREVRQTIGADTFPVEARIMNTRLGALSESVVRGLWILPRSGRSTGHTTLAGVIGELSQPGVRELSDAQYTFIEGWYGWRTCADSFHIQLPVSVKRQCRATAYAVP